MTDSIASKVESWYNVSEMTPRQYGMYNVFRTLEGISKPPIFGTGQPALDGMEEGPLFEDISPRTRFETVGSYVGKASIVGDVYAVVRALVSGV